MEEVNHRKAYEKHQRKRWFRGFLGYLLGIGCLLLYNLIQTSAELEEFLEKTHRVADDRNFPYEAPLLLIEYALISAGISAIVFTTYFLFIKKRD